MHVILILFKIIGIILALVLSLLVLVLAAPVRYSFRFHTDENAPPGGQVKVTWLLHILYVRASYIDKMLDYRVRIFGYQIMGNQKEFLEKKKKREQKKQQKRQRKEEKDQKDKKEQPEPELQALSLPEPEAVSEAEPEVKEKASSGETEVLKDDVVVEAEPEVKEKASSGETEVLKDDVVVEAEPEVKEKASSGETEASEDDVVVEAEPEVKEKASSDETEVPKEDAVVEAEEKEKSAKTATREKSGDGQKKTAGGKTGRKKTVKGKKKRRESLGDKIVAVRTAWQEYHGRQLLDFTKKSIIKILRHVLPRKMRGYIHFGFDDPAVTGLVTGTAAMFYPKYRKTFTLEPDFHQTCFEADCSGRGRIHPGFFLYIGITALMNKDVRNLIKKML